MTKVADQLNEISGIVVDSALQVHHALGPGLLESAYQACLLYELRKRGIKVASQVEMPIHYDNIVIDTAFRIDLFVESKVVVELKALPRVLPIHEAQLLSYLRLSGSKLGLLINFHTVLLRDGITRMVN